MRTSHLLACLVVFLAMSSCSTGSSEAPDDAGNALPPLQVSENGRFLVQELPDGTREPFFWLGDTGWNLHRLNAAEIDRYLSDRAAKGFNVIQGPVLDWTGVAGRHSVSVANAFGHVAYRSKNLFPRLDADRENGDFDDYFDQTDYIIERAGELGLYVVLIPFWAQGLNDVADRMGGMARLRRIGLLLGERYRDRTNVLWIVAGEAAGESRPAAVRALAAGLERGHGGRHLMTVHPGRASSAGTWNAGGESGKYAYHADAWLDFNMLQSGHKPDDLSTYDLISADYALNPVKPTFESEYWYEGDYPDPQRPVSTAYDQRKGGYWSVFAGGFGYTYGAKGIWQFTVRDEPWSENYYRSSDPWEVALGYEGSAQMRHLRRLMESRPFLTRVPDQSLILAGAGGTGDGAGDHVRVTRDGTAGQSDASYIMAYIPVPRPVTIDTRAIASDSLDAWWYDPRTGEASALPRVAQSGRFEAPARAAGPDWVLVIDDARAGHLPPGGVAD